MPAEAFILITLIVSVAATYIAQLWIRHQRRLMVHRERLAALEKGLDLPVVEQEIQRSGWNVQRLLLLAGLVWISIGIGAVGLLEAVANQPVRIPWGYDNTGNPLWETITVPGGLEWVGVAIFGIGFAHLIVYAVGKKSERQ